MAQIAYRIEDAAKACGVGEQRVRDAWSAGDLVPSWPDSHPRFLHDELEAWTRSWSREKPDPKS